MKYIIQTDIPIPTGPMQGRAGGVTTVLRELQPGESFWTPNKTNALFMRILDRKFTCRKEVTTEGVTGYRTWRVK